jgi:hypothetical protein
MALLSVAAASPLRPRLVANDLGITSMTAVLSRASVPANGLAASADDPGVAPSFALGR